MAEVPRETRPTLFGHKRLDMEIIVDYSELLSLDLLLWGFIPSVIYICLEDGAT